MKIAKTILSLTIVATMAMSCGNPENKTASGEESTKTEATTLQQTTASLSENCFDKKMGKWFESFQTYQSNGDDMQLADAKALKDAQDLYTECEVLASR